MMEAFNPKFDERKYWAYGCNCHVLGDRPMSDPGFGPPVDELDTVCKAYKVGLQTFSLILSGHNTSQIGSNWVLKKEAG